MHCWSCIAWRRTSLCQGLIAKRLQQLAQGNNPASGLIGMLDLLSGGTMSNFSILAMGVYPYITAQIILQLLIPIIPALEARMKEDPREGQKWMEKWTIILTIPMALLSAIGQINIFNQMAGWAGAGQLWLYRRRRWCLRSPRSSP